MDNIPNPFAGSYGWLSIGSPGLDNAEQEIFKLPLYEEIETIVFMASISSRKESIFRNCTETRKPGELICLRLNQLPSLDKLAVLVHFPFHIIR
jgi:hypothetical protein